MATNEQALEKALREAADWKARALAAQGAAESMREKAQALKDGATQALQGSRDLQASLQRARGEISALQSEQKEQTRRNSELEEALASSQKERLEVQNSLASVQQQLNLYVAALDESRQGKDLEGIRLALRTVLENPTAEEALEEELVRAREETNELRLSNERSLAKVQEEKHELRLAFERSQSEVQEEMHGLRMAFERSQSELAAMETELRAREEMLEDKEREYFALYGELDLTKSLLGEMRRGTEGSERLQKQYQRAVDMLRDKEAAVSTLESEIRGLLEESQQATVAHQQEVQSYREQLESCRQENQSLAAETLELRQRLESGEGGAAVAEEMLMLKEWILALEDQISDLEIVNSDLYQRLSELEP